MKILFLHGKESGPGGTKPTYLIKHGFTVINPALPADDFDASVRIAQAAFDEHTPDVVVGSSRGGAGAMNINIGDAGLVLLAPAWKKWGTAKTVKPQTRVIHSRQDEIVPFADSEALVASSPTAVLVEIGTDHRLSTPEPLAAMSEEVRAVFIKKEIGAIDLLLRDVTNLCGHMGPEKGVAAARRWRTYSATETEAELTSYLVASRFGIEPHSGDYLKWFTVGGKVPEFSFDSVLVATSEVESLLRGTLRKPKEKPSTIRPKIIQP